MISGGADAAVVLLRSPQTVEDFEANAREELISYKFDQIQST